MVKRYRQCPSCGVQALRERGRSTRKNIKLRSIEDKTDRFVCDNCQITFDVDSVELGNVESVIQWRNDNEEDNV